MNFNLLIRLSAFRLTCIAFSNPTNIKRKLKLLPLLLVATFLTACGGEEANTTATSPVQAVTTLVEHSDGTVEAKLVLIATSVAPNQFVNSATDVSVRIPNGDRVSLTRTSDGHYTANSDMNPELVYLPNETYQFTFELEDEIAKQVSGGNFVAVMEAPDIEVTFEFTDLPEFAGDTSRINWTPSNTYALFSVYDESDNLIYRNFDFEQAQFNGSKWARLWFNGSRTLGVDTFPTAGNYRIELCSLRKVSDFNSALSAELGALSGFLIGRCAEDLEIYVGD